MTDTKTEALTLLGRVNTELARHGAALDLSVEGAEALNPLDIMVVVEVSIHRLVQLVALSK